MIDNFDEVKRQLSELATVINSFKSEAVQLRIIEIVLSGRDFRGAAGFEGQADEKKDSIRKRRKSNKPPAKSDTGASGNSKGQRRSSGTGAVATLASVYSAGFFAEPRAIKDILEHCETNLARKIKANEISGKLGRMVRNGELTRTKNSDGQYEYKKA